MQRNRSRVIWMVALGVAFLVIVDPFRWFEGETMPRMRVNSDLEAEMETFMRESPSAEKFVVDALTNHDIVLIGETGFIREQVLFLTKLIPELSNAGFRHLGLMHAKVSDQPLLDELVTNQSFDESLAQQILFNYQVIYGYQEYVDVFRAAWQENRDLGDGEQPFRIIAVGFTPDYSRIETEEDINDPEIVRQVFANGIPDVMIAENIVRELIEPGIKAPVYVQTPQAFTAFEQPLYAQNMAEQGFPDQKRAGNILRDQYGERVIGALFHTPLRDSRSRVGYGYPLGGVMDNVILSLPEGERSRGFYTEESPFSNGPISADSLTEGIDGDLLFKDLADAYLTLGLISSYTAVTPVPDFITEENLSIALRDFPGPNPGDDIAVVEMNNYIAGNATQMSRVLEQFD